MLKQDEPRLLTDTEIAEFRYSVNVSRLRHAQSWRNRTYCLRCGSTGLCEHSMKRVPTREEIIG